MKYIIQIVDGYSGSMSTSLDTFIWSVDGTTIKRIDVSNPDSTSLIVSQGENIVDFMSNQFPGARFHELALRPGEYFPMMARPYSNSPSMRLGYSPAQDAQTQYLRATSTGQLHALNRQLEEICRVVQPENKNLQSYGHEIRNVLLLACTEVEALWKNVLRANGDVGKSMSSYAKLATPLKLDEFTVSFPYYPWLPPVKPFEKWALGSSAAEALDWYYGYNQTKHDRATHFSEATLGRAFQAVAACFVMLCAQYGWSFARSGPEADREFLYLSGQPEWLPSEVYVPPFGGEWMPKNFKF